MSMNYLFLSLATVQSTLDDYGYKYEPTNTYEFKFMVGSTEYFIYCAYLPEIFIERRIDLFETLGKGFSSDELFFALNAINEQWHLIKASLGEFPCVNVRICLNEERPLVFRDKLPMILRKLDDAVELLKIAFQLYEDNDDPMQLFMDRLMDPEDNSYTSEQLKS